jgi:beta-N-acetylhexosaminidase
MTANLRYAAGSLMVVGLSGFELTGLERAWLKLVRPSGIILFRRNIAEVGQTRALLAESTAYCTSASLRCVDIEGGTVDRLRDAVAPMPSAQAVARTGDPKLMRLHGELIGKEALAFGFNATLAPVLDLALPESAAVMGSRIVSAAYEQVVEYARNFLMGLKMHGIAGCGKHFPGLGGGHLDSHQETPSIRRGDLLWSQDISPYRLLGEELPIIMVNHASYPDQESGATPASVSEFWITAVLRERIGYKGLIFSDDLEMGGILNYMPIEEAAVAAIRAGMHLVEICHRPELILRAYEALVSEAERSAAFRELLMERAQNGQHIREKHFTNAVPQPPSETELADLREQVLRFGSEIQSLSGEAA